MEQWQKELTQCVRTVSDLERYLPLQNKEKIITAMRAMRLSITPHTLSLIHFDDPQDPLLRMAVPREEELFIAPEELVDPIGDETRSPIPFLTHRYPDRVLLYATFNCSHYCRFCFRRFKTGHATPGPTSANLEKIYHYLREHIEVDEVILTGGDPFTLLDGQIAAYLEALRKISTIHRIRFHTRVPVNLPSRITPTFVALLKKYIEPTRPIYIVTHFNHPREIAKENIIAIERLVDAGIVVKNQSVFLRRVNDSSETLAALFKMLSNIRVQPYYLHQLDLAKGTGHFRVPIDDGIKIMQQLQGKITGIAIPRYMLDIPGGKGKVPLVHQYVKKNDAEHYIVETPTGEEVSYQEPI